MKFYLGSPRVPWLGEVDFPLFLSRRILRYRRWLPHATCDWVLDSGAFSELALNGRWNLTAEAYAEEVRILSIEVGRMDWAASMDYMCEPWILRLTKLTVEQHQLLTVQNFLRLRQELGTLVVPVLQGYRYDDYLRCVEMYDKAGVDLESENIVGLGSVCKRQATGQIKHIVEALYNLGLKLHGFGVKRQGLALYGHMLSSADSMAWNFKASKEPALEGCNHKHCTNCLRYATKWREELLAGSYVS